jgi:hypothetical protein
MAACKGTNGIIAMKPFTTHTAHSSSGPYTIQYNNVRHSLYTRKVGTLTPVAPMQHVTAAVRFPRASGAEEFQELSP